MTRAARRLTSPQGTMLERGEETRRAVLAALPGTIRDLSLATSISHTTVKHTVTLLAQRGVITSVGTATPKGGGTVHNVWGVAPPARVNSDPFSNAWYDRLPLRDTVMWDG